MILAIIDHNSHQLFIENVSDDELQNKYNGEEEDYIKDKYGFGENDNFSWEYLKKRTELFGLKNGKIPIHANR